MNPAFMTLLTIAHVAAEVPKQRAALTIAPIEAIVASLLNGTPLAAEQPEITAMLADVPAGGAAFGELAQRIDYQMTDDLEARFARMGRILEDVLLIERALRSELVQTATLELQDPAIFSYIQRWDMRQLSEGLPVALVGFLDLTVDGLSLHIPSPQFVARRTTITYNSATPYPRLSLNVLSAASISAMRAERVAWEQRAGAEYRLHVFTGGRKLTGYLQTHQLPPPFTIAGERISLTFPLASGVTALVTDVCDEHGQASARALRLHRLPNDVNAPPGRGFGGVPHNFSS